MAETEVVPVQIADDVIAKLIVLISRRLDDLDTVRLVKREQFVGVADHE
jgi:hypothetical protein